MTKSILLFLVIASLVSISGNKPSDGTPILGKWVSRNGGGHIEMLNNTDGSFSGKMVWLAEPNYPEGDPEAGKPKRDRKNPDPAKQSAPLLGLTVLKGFSYTGNGNWTHGTVYDPRSGKTYKCKLSMADSGSKLKIRGYIGISLIGKTDVMTRYKDGPAPATTKARTNGKSEPRFWAASCCVSWPGAARMLGHYRARPQGMAIFR